MQRGARTVGALLLALLVLAPAIVGQPGDPADARVQRFEVDPPEQPVETGDWVPIRAVIAPTASAKEARLHVRAAGPDGVEELEPAPSTVRGEPVLLVTFWEPGEPGRYIVSGHVHIGDERVPLPIREGRVWSSQALDRQPVDPSTWAIGIAPGTVLWSLAFMGLAYASQRWLLDRDDN